MKKTLMTIHLRFTIAPINRFLFAFKHLRINGYLAVIFISMLLMLGCTGKNVQKLQSTDHISGFDEALAKQLGADDYGMKKYVMAFLKAGPNRSGDQQTRMQLQRAHLDNITRLANEGKLVLAGPFLDSGDIRGIYIFDVETIEEAEALTKTDPAIQAGSLIMELHPWYGSAALLKINAWHERIAKRKI